MLFGAKRWPVLRGTLDWLSGALPRKREIECETWTLGNPYGAHHVCPDGLDANSIVYSFGIGEDISFDLALIKRTGATVHAFDPTPRALAWVSRQVLPTEFRVHPYGIADYDGIGRFFPPKNPNHVSHSLLERGSNKKAIEAPVHRLTSIMEDLQHEEIDVLKMDIEGAEYDVLLDVLPAGIPIRQILIEFHHQLKGIPRRRTLAAIDRLQAHGYKIFYVAENLREYSLIRR
jgi:FkbM family methyltransferase